MKKIGIVAEFNPFHNGHKYLIEQARKLTQADCVIVAMSGDFVQRGTPAFMDKYDRTRIALENGADLVLMLPVSISTSSAEGFATGAVRMLYEAGIDTLCFGVENDGAVTTLTRIAELLLNETEEFKFSLQNNIKEGYNYPTARTRALKETYEISDEVISLMESPNNQLAIEYIKAAKKAQMDVDFFAVKRVDNGYHSEEATDSFASASYIRKGLMNANSCTQKHELRKFLPGYEIDRFVFDYNSRLNDYLFLALLQMKEEVDNGSARGMYLDILDLNSDLRDRILSLLPEYKDFHQFANLVKNKSITYTRVCRVLIHILLGISADDAQVKYLRVLGMREESKKLLGEISKNTSLPLVVQLSDYVDIIAKDLHAGRVYESLLGEMKNELSRRLMVI